MKKWTKKDYLNITVLLTIFMVLVFILIKNNYLYGSKTDWLTQHVTIPEYLRNLFYQTHDINPSFAPHLSGGVNIYYLSYYGLFNPIILISYLLPFVKMVDYIQISSIILVMLSVILFYRFIRKKHDANISFITTLIFLCACPITFHSHRHLMFINYMPFLILALEGVERYFDKKKSGLLIISTFLIIMCSYFYSVGAIVVLVLYGIYYYMKDNKLTIKSFFKDGFRFLLPIITSVLMAMIIILPTLYVILTGRNDTNVQVDLKGLFTPNLYIKYALYKNYGMGLTSIFIVSLVEHLKDKKSYNKFLSIVFILFLTIPIFVYILNGGMYLDSKVLIPFIPLATLMISNTLKRLFESKDNNSLILIMLIVSVLILMASLVNKTFYLIDIILVLIGIFFIKKKYILKTVLIFISLFNLCQANFSDILIEKKELTPNKNLYEASSKLTLNDRNYRTVDAVDHLYRINKVHNMDEYKTSIYSSTVNLNYQNFYFHTFLNANPNRNLSMMGDNLNIFFQYYMGSRYLINNEASMIGYSKVKDSVFENQDVYPIGYVNHNVISKKQFDLLPYPENIYAMLKYSVVDDYEDIDYKNHSKEIEVGYNLLNKTNLDIVKIEDDSKTIKSNGIGFMKVHVDNPNNYKTLILQFRLLKDQSCKKGDMSITINGIRNVLTCHSWKYHNQNFVFNYVISSNEPIETLELEFSDGTYLITDSKLYTIDYEDVKNLAKEVDKFNIDYELSKGDKIVGEVNALDNGYFQMSIPYDEGFEILVDNKKQDYEIVDTAFIGFKMNKGKHKVEIVYTSPTKKISMAISFIGLVLLGIQLFMERKR